jgi:arsenite transporter
MFNMLRLIQKNLVWAIPISMASGLGFGYFFNTAFLKQFIIPVTFIMVYPMMTTLNIKSVFKGEDYKLQVTTQVINFVIIPVVAYLTGRLFFSGGPEKYALWAVGLFLIGVLPTSGMTISWTGFARGNKEAAIKMVVFGLVIGALAAPVYTKVFMGTTIEVNMLHMFKQIALFVFVPLIAGLATQSFLRKKYGEKVWKQRLKPKFPPFSALGVILIAFVAMSLKAKSIIANPGDILIILAPLTVFYLVSYALLSIVGRLFFDRDNAIAMVFGVVMRDLSIALAIAMTAFGKQGFTIALLIALAYVIQIQTAAWYVKLVDRIFGKTMEKAKTTEASEPAPMLTVNDKIPGPLPLEGHAMVPDIKRILYTTDLSDAAQHAVRYACSIGHQYGAKVTLLHVIPDIVEEISIGTGINLVDHMGKNEWESLNKKGIEAARMAIHERIKETSNRVTKEIPQCPLDDENVVVRLGNPVEQILSTARTGNHDLIIMGTHGHGKIGQSIIGSVAGEVIRRCSRPVMVVRLPEYDGDLKKEWQQDMSGSMNNKHRRAA